MIRYRDFADLIDCMVASEPGRVALLHSPKSEEGMRGVTWGELAERVRVRAEELAAGGRACEAILADGSVECIVEVFAAVEAGVQVALVDPLMPNQVMAPLLQAVDADCVWAAHPYAKESWSGF